MHIRRIFHSESDLTLRLSQRFLRRWKRMLALYEKHHRGLSKAVALKCISVAWAFCSSVAEGNASVPYQIKDVLEHQTKEWIEIGGEPLAFDDEDTASQLIWDTVCLMLEEKEPQPEWQYAFDMAGIHAAYAYKKEVMEETEASFGDIKAVRTTTISKEVSVKFDEMTSISNEIALLSNKSLAERQAGTKDIMRRVIAHGLVLPSDLREALLHLDDDKPQPINYKIEVQPGGTNICHTDKVTI